MRFVIQRVTEATCEVDQKITGQITNGFCVLIGIAETDTKNIADKMIRKLLGMRIFGDENGKTNLSLHDIEGSLLLISQFTLYADCRKGNRPSLSKPEIRNLQTISTNILLQNAKKKFRMYKPESLVQI